jgi:spore coat polysaccharide biosynthesis protein SpsF
MNEEFLILVQARTGSTRFPNKVLQEVCGKPILIHQLERVKQSKFNPKIVVITTNNPNDDNLVDLCNSYGYLVFRGSEEDVLSRHYFAATLYGYKWIVKIPSDCPLIDYRVIDSVFESFISEGASFDYYSNLHPPTYPDGNDVEIMRFEALCKVHKEANKNFEREHTTPYFWENPALFKVGNKLWESGLDHSMSHRFTLDYPADWEFIKIIFEKLYPQNPFFGLSDILNLLENEPEIFSINRQLAGINWYRNHLDELKTINENSTKYHE